METILTLKNELIIFIMSMLPVWELRGTIPFAIEAFNFSISKAVLISLMGNTVPVILILAYIEKIADWLSKRSVLLKKIFDYVFEHTRKKHSARFELVAEIALFSFVAIPLPGTGGWSGALISVVFNMDKKRSFFAIFLGLVGAAAIVTASYSGAKNFFQLFLS